MSQWTGTTFDSAVFELLDGEHLPSSSPSHDGLSSPSHSGASPISPYSAASPSGDEALVSLCNTDAPMGNFDDFSSGVLSQEFAFPDSAMEFDLGTSAPASLLSVDLGPMDTAMDTTMDPLMPSSDLGVAAAHCLPAPTMTTTTTKPSVDQKPTKSIKKRKPTRKAKKVAPSSLANKMDLNFTREEVLNMTCEQLDRIVENIQLTRELTKEEDQEVRKHRRLIKNRESAAASRKRKRGMVEELETKLSAYKTENDSLKENLARLSKENEELRERLAIATGNSAWRLGRGNMPSAKAGLCLMVVLLSFGLVFNQFQPSTGSGDLASALANYQFPAVDTFGRVAPELGGALSLPQAAHSELASPARRQLLSAGRGYSVIVDEDRKDPAVIEPMVIEQNDPTITVDHRFNPNTTYITILDGKQEGRPLNDSFPEDGSPFLIELIIPTESAAAEEEMLEYETSLEITCKVIETRLSTHVLGSRGELSSSPAQGTGTLTVM